MRAKYRALIALASILLSCTPPVFAVEPQAAPPTEGQTRPADPLRFDYAGGHFKVGIDVGIQGVIERKVFWKLSQTFAPTTPYKTGMSWGEAYFKPSLTFEHRLGGGWALYGGASFVAAKTMGRDIFDARDQGRILPEAAYAGVRFADPASGLKFDLSAGRQDYKIGSGMLISDGGTDGFERGAMIFGPRQSWAMTAIARAGFGQLSVEAFYLDANELSSGDTSTRLAGGKAEWALAKGQMLGVAYGQALQSTAPYPKAAPGGVGVPAILTDARDDLQFVHAYARVNPLQEAAPGLWLAGDLALQWNNGIDLRASGARAEIGYAFDAAPWAPKLSYTWQTFSGDNPNTPRLERFDPLFYDGSPGGWATGSNGSFVFINSNISSHKLTAAFTVTPQDYLTLRYTHIRANQLNSPVQFGQATRLGFAGGVPMLVAGVTNAHLSDDFLAEYTRVLTPNAYLSLGYAYSMPGQGLKQLAPGQLTDWHGGFVNLVVRY